MTVERMRSELISIPEYKSPGWKHKVDKMSNRQIMAVYFSCLNRGMLNKEPIKPLEPRSYAEQLSLF